MTTEITALLEKKAGTILEASTSGSELQTLNHEMHTMLSGATEEIGKQVNSLRNSFAWVAQNVERHLEIHHPGPKPGTSIVRALIPIIALFLCIVVLGLAFHWPHFLVRLFRYK
jgi:hypothetical protein